MNSADPSPSLAAAFPGAEAPARSYPVDAWGVEIAVHEWGEATDPPLFMLHGGFDFARTFSVFAPRLAAGGWRVVSWDQRGHGDSAHCALYNWDADVRDALAVMDTVTSEPAPLIGHSKGGVMSLQLVNAQPWRFTRVANLDGIPSRHPMPDVADHERTRLLATEVAEWLDYRRTTATRLRRPGTLDELAARRHRMNPRLSIDWLRFLVTAGGREDADGWRWKIDPAMRFGGFGPWRPEWSQQYLAAITVPFFGLLATEPEPMGWNTRLDALVGLLPRGAHVEELAGCGHFLHIEQPDLVAAKVLEFLS